VSYSDATKDSGLFKSADAASNLSSAARRKPELFSCITVAWSLHGIGLWLWHAPGLFQAALESELIHALQHLSFLGFALLFWWALIHGRQGPLGYGAAVFHVFTTAMHSGVLGVLLTFAPTLWYPAYAGSTASWGLTPVEDQQLAGLIVWVPTGVLYLIAGLALFAGWLRALDRRGLPREGQVWP
jgi:putative membrane protein